MHYNTFQLHVISASLIVCVCVCVKKLVGDSVVRMMCWTSYVVCAYAVLQARVYCLHSDNC